MVSMVMQMRRQDDETSPGLRPYTTLSAKEASAMCSDPEYSDLTKVGRRGLFASSVAPYTRTG